MGFLCGSDSKESACNAGDLGLIPGWKIPWRREWLPTPEFLPGEFHGQRSLVGYSSWGHKESDMTEQLTLSIHTHKKEYYSASRKKEGNSAICNNTDEPRGHYVK